MLLLLGLAWVALPSPIEDFLQKNGVSDVKENFLENEVTLQVVRLLTDDDLTKLGLLTIGRRRLFNTVATRDINFGILIKIPQKVELDLP